MNKFIIIIVFVFGTVNPTSAQKQEISSTGYFNIGASIPSSLNVPNNLYKTGFHGIFGIGFNTRPSTQLVGKIEYHTFSLNKRTPSRKGKRFSVLMFGGLTKLDLGVPSASTKLFIITGIGMAKTLWDRTNINYPYISYNETKFYYELGGDIDFKSFFFMARYVSIGTSDSPTRIFPISLGIKF